MNFIPVGSIALSGGKKSDEELMIAAGLGDRLAASELIVRHTDNVYGLCFRTLKERSLAEDATQETFMRVWKSAKGWTDKGAKFKTWLYRVAINVCYDRLRKAKSELPEDSAPIQIDPAPGADSQLIIDEQARLVNDAVSALPKRQGLALNLCHYQELSNAEAAEIMETSVDAIESLLSRARRSLRDGLLPYYKDLRVVEN